MYGLSVLVAVLGHFGHSRFGLDISATENAEGGRFGYNHKFCVSDMCMHKCVMHFLKSSEISYSCEYFNNN